MTNIPTQEQKEKWWQALLDLQAGKITLEELIARHAEFGADEYRIRSALQRK
jgi:DNA-binding transcriptional regulator PaaX